VVFVEVVSSFSFSLDDGSLLDEEFMFLVMSSSSSCLSSLLLLFGFIIRSFDGWISINEWMDFNQ